MKNFLIPIILIVSILLTSCQDKGETSLYLSGKENTLPDELKGLKVYSVSTGAGTYVKVAILDGQINSTTYSVGKFEESTIILNRQNDQIIEVSQVIMENDSLVVCRKLTRSI